MERAPSSGLERGDAQQGAEALQLAGSSLLAKLRDMGTLTQQPLTRSQMIAVEALNLPDLRHDAAASLLLGDNVLIYNNRTFARFFKDIVYVFVTSMPDGGIQLSCTCATCLRYFHCEHQVFVESLTLPTATASRDFSDLPMNRPRGRPRGSTVLRGVRDAARAGARIAGYQQG